MLCHHGSVALCVCVCLVEWIKVVNSFELWLVLDERDSSRLKGSVKWCGGDREW